MQQSASTSLAAILPKTADSILAGSPHLPYKWKNKLRSLVVGICLSRSLVLQSIAQTMPQRVKTTEDKLSKVLAKKRFAVQGQRQACVLWMFNRLTRRRIWKHEGKAAVVIDTTEHAKERSRGKVRPMPGAGKVRVHNLNSKETILVPGYQEIWVGILLKDKSVLPLVRRLWSEKGPQCASMNIVEEALILEARDIVKKELKLDVILVADRGFRRKNLLHWLKSEGMDFVIRLQGKLTVELAETKGLLSEVSPWWDERTKIPWRDKANRALVSSVASRRVTVSIGPKKSFCFNVLCLTPVREKLEPMLLASTLTTEKVDDLVRIVRLYSRRWGIETFFWNFKQGLKADSWRVFSCWEAIDHLLEAALMAYLILLVLAEFARRGRTAALREVWDWMEDMLRNRFARPAEMTQGRFMRLLAMDFPSPRLAGGGA